MSTNYYMLTQNKKLADTYFPEEYELYRGGDVFKAEIHIGKKICRMDALIQGAQTCL